MKNVGTAFTASLVDAAVSLGIKLGNDTVAIRNYAGERMMHLAGLVNQAGYQEAVHAEAMNVALFSLGRAIDDADLADQALVQVAVGLLGMGARLL